MGWKKHPAPMIRTQKTLHSTADGSIHYQVQKCNEREKSKCAPLAEGSTSISQTHEGIELPQENDTIDSKSLILLERSNYEKPTK